MLQGGEAVRRSPLLLRAHGQCLKRYLLAYRMEQGLLRARKLGVNAGQSRHGPCPRISKPTNTVPDKGRIGCRLGVWTRSQRPLHCPRRESATAGVNEGKALPAGAVAAADGAHWCGAGRGARQAAGMEVVAAAMR